MNRSEFLRMCTLLGIGLPLHGTVSACSKTQLEGVDLNKKVIIVGAGAAGLTAGYLLQQLGVEFEILEASNQYGGRIRVDHDFADFPIPLGAEWLHTSIGVFEEIVNDSSVSVRVNTTGYNSQTDTWAMVKNGQLSDLENVEDRDRKFVNYSWLHFYEEYILPSIADRIRYGQAVKSIHYSTHQITMETRDTSFTCDRGILAVPLKILQKRHIAFIPDLTPQKWDAWDAVNIWDGFKAFFAFSEPFYHTGITFDIQPETRGQKLFYDAAYGQNTEQHILGLFTTGEPATHYGQLSTEELKASVLAELDQFYNHRASASYLRHISQNWNAEPFIKGGYLSDHTPWRRVRKLREPIENKLYFAGGPFTDGEDWVSVHAAAASAKEAVEQIVRS